MLQENPKASGQADLYRARLESIIDPRHELVKLAGKIDWSGLQEELSVCYCPDNGRPGGSIRLMAGLQMLKDMKGLSDEEVCGVWRENPYLQIFAERSSFSTGCLWSHGICLRSRHQSRHRVDSRNTDPPVRHSTDSLSAAPDAEGRQPVA